MSRPNRRYNNRENNRIIAGLLAFIGGTFGIHRFYLNDIGGGIFYIFLFFITMKFFPVTLILGIIEALRLFNMDPEAFDKKYNQGIEGQSKRFQGKNRPRYQKERSNGNSRSRQRSNGNSRSSNKSRYTRKRNVIPKRNPFKISGLQKYKEFDLEDAIVDFNKALKLADQDPEIHFYLAAVYSLSEKKEKAFMHLELSVKYGLKDPEKIETFEDLAYLRIQDEFEAFRDNAYKSATESSPKKEEIKESKEEVLDDDILLSQLNKLDELRNRGLISNEEFLIEKEKLIDHNK